MLERTSTETPKSGGGTRFLPSRRGFLIGTGAAVGLVVAYALWPRDWPGGMVANGDEKLLGPWIKIAEDGRITVAVPQAEMGQGVYSGFAQIIADELGADWRLMGVEPAPFHPAYAHVGMARNGTAGLPPMVRGIAAKLGDETIRRLNLHLTGGSTSIMGYHDILREAAAEARARLIAAAAARWEVNADDLDTANGFVVYKANRMSFADAVAAMDPAHEPAAAPLRAVAARPLAGKALPRIDIPAKVDGSARFGADVRLPGMVFAAIRHGPVGGSLVSARAPAGTTMVKGPNWVAATGVTNWEARRAVDAIDASFAVSGRKADGWITEELAKAAAGTEGDAVAEHGDATAALGANPITADYSLPFLAHAAMEPMTATARISQGQVELWGPTQSQTIAHWKLAEALGVDSKTITIHPQLVGGGFGRKAEPDAMVEAALIARAVGKPVQLLWSREEDLSAGSFRPPVHARLKGRLDAQGGIAALDVRVAVPGPNNSFSQRYIPLMASETEKPSAMSIEGAAEIPYAVGAFRAVHVPLPQPVPLGFWRSVGNSFSAFLIESFIDELAEAAKADPLAFRLKLLAEKPRHAAVLRAAATAGGWGEAAAKGMARGLALHESFGSIAAVVVEAGVQDGRIRIGTLASALDCGTAIAPDSVRAQMEGSAIMGLSAAIGEAQVFSEGIASNSNFHAYEILRLADAPARIVTTIVNSGAPLGGVGEPALPPVAPALANALARATGKRARQLPLAATYQA